MKTPNIHPTAFIAPNATVLGDVTVGEQSSFFFGAVARSEFAEQHPAAVEDFLAKHAESVQYTKDDVDGAAALVVEAGIVAKEPVAKAAIPKCNVVCLTGDEMRDALSGYLQVLFEADASSVGGALPEDDFYYLGA